jgi:hypothetical protein
MLAAPAVLRVPPACAIAAAGQAGEFQGFGALPAKFTSSLSAMTI